MRWRTCPCIVLFLFLFASCRPDGLLHDDAKPTDYQLPDQQAYYRLQKMESEIAILTKQYSGIVATKKLTPKTAEGRDIQAIKISDNVAQDEDEKVVVLLGGEHAREWLAVSTVFLLMKNFVQQYNTDARIKKLVDSWEIWIVPIMNPDGYIYSWTENRYWRKNRARNDDGSYGVDLNRNWGYKWGYDTRGSSPNTHSIVYRGTKPFSERETQAIRDLLKTVDPDLFIDYHSYGQLILYPYGYINKTAEDQRIATMAKKMSDEIYKVHKHRYKPQVGYALYPTNGDSIDYVYATYKIPSYVIEVRPTGSGLLKDFAPPSSQIQPTYEEQRAGLFYLMEELLVQ